MKHLLTIMAFLPFFCIAQQKKATNSLSNENLKGNIKSLSTYVYYGKVSDGDIIPDSLMFKKIATFDEHGNMLLEADSNTRFKKSRSIQQKNKYDKQGHHIETDTYLNDSLLGRVVFTVDARGYETEQDKFRKQDMLMTRTVNKYDNNGNLLNATVYTHTGSMADSVCHKYDANGHETESVAYIPPGKTIRTRAVYNYDARGNMLKMMVYTGDGKFNHMETHKYDSRNREIETIIYPHDTLDKAHTNDEQKIKFDDQGNCIKSMDLRHKVVTIRTIEYYK
jgi:hypothetical protein